VFEGIKQAVVAARYAYFDDFFNTFYNTDVFAPERIGDAALRASFAVAAGASPYASYACVDAWLTDFRGDLPKIDVPTLVVHGTGDRILPYESTAARLRDERLIATTGDRGDWSATRVAFPRAAGGLSARNHLQPASARSAASLACRSRQGSRIRAR
jgi:pimeloyl-ACP methyl ester carboxylesterase